jgi:hypothetical protein
MIVEFCSAAMSPSTCRFRSCSEMGWAAITSAASASRPADVMALLPLGLGLPGHGALHRGRQLDVLELHPLDVDAPPRAGVLQDQPNLVVERVGLAQHRVQRGLAHHVADRGLGNLIDRRDHVLHLHDRLHRVHRPVVGDRGDADRDAVAGDDLLLQDGQGHRADADLAQRVDQRHGEAQPWLAHAADLAEPEHHAALVLLHYVDAETTH